VNIQTLPEPDFYTIQTLAEKWGCSQGVVLNYALTGQLQLSVESQGWKIEYGLIEKDDDGRWFSIPEEIKISRSDVLQLSFRDQKELVRHGIVSSPSFQEEKYAYASSLSDTQGNEITIYLNDIIVSIPDANDVFDKTEREIAEEKSTPETLDESTKPRKAIDSVEFFYKEGIKIYDKMLQDSGKDPSLKAIVRELSKMAEFQGFSFETIKRYMNKQELIKQYQKSKKR
jgi:antitoxin component of MazEF toxin-antitoxin module